MTGITRFHSDGEVLLWELRGQGFDVRLQGSGLTVDPGSRLSEDMISQIREYKAEVIQVLTEEEEWLTDPARLWLLLGIGYGRFDLNAEGFFVLEPADLVWPRLIEAVNEHRAELVQVAVELSRGPGSWSDGKGFRA